MSKTILNGQKKYIFLLQMFPCCDPFCCNKLECLSLSNTWLGKKPSIRVEHRQASATLLTNGSSICHFIYLWFHFPHFWQAAVSSTIAISSTFCFITCCHFVNLPSSTCHFFKSSFHQVSVWQVDEMQFHQLNNS